MPPMAPAPMTTIKPDVWTRLAAAGRHRVGLRVAAAGRGPQPTPPPCAIPATPSSAGPIAPLAARNGARPADKAAYLEPGTPVKAGLYALASGREALAARVVLADAAERALDIQYYIWRNDRSGTFMFNAIRRAADRGVRVRLLLDDNNTVGQDPILWTLDQHPNIEVRLFNPFAQRSMRMFGFLTDFKRLNRRMHNKSFTADNQATIIGGRNIGDEYFDATDERAFADLDVLAVGAIVDQVSTDFDRYWASESAYPLDRLLPPVPADVMKGLLEDIASVDAGGPGYSGYADAVQNARFLRDLFDGKLELEWAMTRMVSDDPRKVLDKAPAAAPLPERMEKMIGKPTAIAGNGVAVLRAAAGRLRLSRIPREAGRRDPRAHQLAGGDRRGGGARRLRPVAQAAAAGRHRAARIQAGGAARRGPRADRARRRPARAGRRRPGERRRQRRLLERRACMPRPSRSTARGW